MQEANHIIMSVCLGIALSACCGFRIFIPLLAASIAVYNGWMEVPPDMQWIGGVTAIISFSTATILEISAYYIPFLDNMLDFIAAPLAVIAGTLLASSIIPFSENEPLFRWGIGLLAGGATAGTIQLGTGMIRIFSTKATVGAGNALVASAENVVALTGTLLSFIIPIFMAILLVILVFWVLFRTIKRLVRHEERVF
ncbi:MAG: DUF4126 domain-containing protein [Chitinophagaceae bacterium]